jgi:phosphatidylglycerol---prolipoprotein diacylglyceryl transferase
MHTYLMFGPFTHTIDPVIASIGGFAIPGGVHLWWYGLSYTLGFLGIFLWFRRGRVRLGMTRPEVYDIGLYLAIGVLLGGRIVEVAFYEWDYYGAHTLHIPAYWLGGMSTHGLLLGATLGTLLFCRLRKRRFLDIADELVIAGAWVMGVGRLGNFFDGQISGAVTDVWWAVKFPDLDGFRHPVVLYDGLKNLLLIPLLLWIRSRRPPRGVVFAHFLLWYAGLRLGVDLFREYRVESLGLGTGQVINIVMSLTGLALLIWFHQRGRPAAPVSALAEPAEPPITLWPRRVAFTLLLLACLVMPSDWTQDVPARYGQRHAGMEHSWLYPAIPERAPTGSIDSDAQPAP